MNDKDEDVKRHVHNRLDAMFNGPDFMGLLIGLMPDTMVFDLMADRMMQQMFHKGRNLLGALKLQVVIEDRLPRVNKEDFIRRIDRLYCDWIEITQSPENAEKVFGGSRDTYLGNSTRKFTQFFDFYEVMQEKGLEAAMAEFPDFTKEVMGIENLT